MKQKDMKKGRIGAITSKSTNTTTVSNSNPSFNSNNNDNTTSINTNVIPGKVKGTFGYHLRVQGGRGSRCQPSSTATGHSAPTSAGIRPRDNGNRNGHGNSAARESSRLARRVQIVSKRAALTGKRRVRIGI